MKDSRGFPWSVDFDESCCNNQPQVFREGSNDGYGFLPSPVKLQGVCSQEHSEKMAGVWDNSSWLAFLVEGWWFQTCFFIFLINFPQILGEMIQFWRSHMFQLGFVQKPPTSSILVSFFLQKCPGDSNWPYQTSPLIWGGGVTNKLWLNGSGFEVFTTPKKVPSFQYPMYLHPTVLF